MNKSRKKKNEFFNKPIEIKKTYTLWEEYNQFFRSTNIDIQFINESSKKKLALNFLKKIFITLIGSLITTISSYFFIIPNKIYSPSLSGLVQKISEWKVGQVGSNEYYNWYYGINFFVNLVIISVLWLGYDANLYEIVTGLFYVLFQIMWTKLFEGANLRGILFSNFSPASDSSFRRNSTNNDHMQLTRLFPYYALIAAIASIIHTYGYSLLFRSRATPGGLEIIAAYFSTKYGSNFSISKWLRLFSFFILFLSTLFDFFFIKNIGDRSIKAYFQFITTNDLLLATIFYIIFSSISMDWFFPRGKIVFLQLYLKSEDYLLSALRLLKNFSPVYHENIYQIKEGAKKKVCIVECYLSQWNYFLIEPDLKKISEKVNVNRSN